MFLIIEKKEETTFDFSKNSVAVVIVNLLNDSNNESSKFSTRKWYIINDQNNGQYGRGNENDSSIKFEAKVIKPNLFNYSDAYTLVT